MQTFHDGLRHYRALRRDSTVDGGCARAHTHLALALAEAQADGGVDVEMQLAEIRPGYHAILFAVEGIAGGNSGVGDTFEFAGRRVVVQRLLHDIGVQVISLLLTVANRRGTGDNAIIDTRVILDLAPSLTTTFRATLVVRVDFIIAHVVKSLGKLLPYHSNPPDTTVSHHIQRLVVDSPNGKQEHGIKRVIKPTKATVRDTGNRTVHDTTRKRASAIIDGIYHTAGSKEALLEVGRAGQPVLQVDIVAAAVVRVGEGHVAVVVGGVGEEQLAAR